jgi:flagellar hook-associated protein 1 FlgK
MPDLLSIGTSGVRTYQRSLATVGNNIANVDSEGYSRQRLDMNQDTGVQKNNLTPGSGVISSAVKRAYDEFATGALRSSTAGLSTQESLYDQTRKLENIIGDTSLSLTNAIDRFFEAANALSTTPSSASSREYFLSEAQFVASRFKMLSDQMDQLREDAFTELASNAKTIGSLASQIAKVNEGLLGKKSVNDQPNGMLDQRDSLLQELSELTDFTVVENENGSVDVYLGKNNRTNTLVDGIHGYTLSIEQSEQDPNNAVVLLDPYGSPRPVSNIAGGKVSGISTFINDPLRQTQNNLDEIAKVFVTSVNSVQTSGLDATGNYGRELFGYVDESQRPSSQIQVLLKGADEVATGAPLVVNQGGSSTTLSIASWQNNTTDAVRSGEKVIQDLWVTDDSLTDFSANENAPAFVMPGNQINGLSLDIDADGGSAHIDIYTRSGKHLFSTGKADPADLVKQIAGFDADATYSDSELNASGADSFLDMFRITDNGDDTYTLNVDGQPSMDILVFVTEGTASFSGGWYEPSVELTQANMSRETQISFTTANQYQVVDVASGSVIGSYDYEFGDEIAFNGWVAKVDNVPKSGDVFTVGKNTYPKGDNRNALTMAALQSNRDIFQGRGTFGELYADTINDLGSIVVQASISRDAQQVLVDEAKERRDGVSAVSLDEEAADLLRFQQAYQASAQVIQMANKMFDAIVQLR